MNDEEIQHALNEQRLFVLIEHEDGKVRQIMLSPERFKKVSDATFAPHFVEQPSDLRVGYDIGCHHIKGEWELDADLFLGLSSSYEDADKHIEDDE